MCQWADCVRRALFHFGLGGELRYDGDPFSDHVSLGEVKELPADVGDEVVAFLVEGHLDVVRLEVLAVAIEEDAVGGVEGLGALAAL